MPPSRTQLCVREVSKNLLVSLRPEGFRRQSPHLFRENNEIVHSINFQCSQWGSSSKGSFTINLCVSNRELFPLWTGRSFPKNPGTAIWPVSMRIGKLDSNYDRWWEVDETTDPCQLAASIDQQYRGAILDMFARLSSLDDLDEALARFKRYGDVPGIHEAQAPLIRAIISSTKGNQQFASELLTASAASSRGSSFERRVSIIAERLGIEIG